MGHVLNQELHPERILQMWVLGIITNGSIHIKIGECEKEIFTNEYYLIPPNVRHLGTKKSEYNVIYFHFEAEYEISDTISNDHIVIPIFGKVPISINYQNIHNYFRHALISNVITQSLMTIQVESILLQLNVENSIKRLSSDRLWNIVQDINHFLSNNYYHEITHERLEKEFCYSYVHLNRVFKKYTKKSIFKQLETIRIEAAEEKILMGQQIKSVHTQVGFEDYYYFLKKFKKITGMTPSAFYRNYFIT
jgi:YesN/AraC family two-component response regulator